MDIKQFSQNLDATYNRIRANLKTSSRDYKWRVTQLKALKKMLVDNDDRICQAMWDDVRKSRFECTITEQGVVLAEIEYTLTHLSHWMEPIRVSTPLYNQPGSCKIYHDPLGLALVIGAWNYPIQLLLAPFVGAISGGNACILKPSELTVKTAALIAELIPKYLDTNLFAVVEGGVEETDTLLGKEFDTIFFTGSGPVGKIVMSKAAKYLTPVTLELGGKSPAVVLPDANIEVAARRIAWGKFMNAGQTCVAPDYILVHPKVRDQFVEELKKSIKTFYPGDIAKSGDYCRIINQKNFDRLKALINPNKILFGGDTDRGQLYIGPTLVSATTDEPIMEQEIFGPILPIVEMSEQDEMIRLINSKPKPLALYVFSSSSKTHETFLRQTSSGGVCLNDVIMHLPVPDLPFGGVGASGMGHYHGKFSFKTFTHSKAVLDKATWIDLKVRYAPYTLRNLKILRWLF